MAKQNFLLPLLVLMVCCMSIQAWVPSRFGRILQQPTQTSQSSCRVPTFLGSSSADKSSSGTTSSTKEVNNAKPTTENNSLTVQQEEAEEEEDDDDYEYIEYEILRESEFVGSEWLMGTNWNNSPNKIDETWVRLAIDPNTGKNIAIWGDNSQGTWNLDVASQFLSISKENIVAGKEIWACTTDDYYYLQGTVRGWKYWQPAAVLAQWQAKRLGVDPDEAGEAPWFQSQEEEQDEEGQPKLEAGQ